MGSRLWWLLLPVVALLSCGGETPTSPDRDWIEFVSLTPASGTALTAGERVTFTTTVACTVASSDGGRVALLLQDQGNRSLQTAPPTETLPKGDKTVTMSDTITVPVSGSTVSLYVPLFVNGSNSTRAMKLATYTVR
jgi:hypothetical protein